ncbi:MAG: hypothetical protein ABW360_02055 [Phenylobacterium sp.]
MSTPPIEIARLSRLKTLAVFLLFIGITVGAAWANWTHPEWNPEVSTHTLLGVVIAGAVGTYMFSFKAARAALGGPAVFVSDGRLVFLFRSHRSCPLSAVTGVGLQKVPIWGRIWFRVEIRGERPFLASTTLFSTPREEVLARCAAAGLPVREAFAADGTTDTG